MLREGVKWKKTWKKNLGGPLVPPNGNLHGGLMLQIAQKSIYMDKKLTPHVGANGVNNFDHIIEIGQLVLVQWY